MSRFEALFSDPPAQPPGAAAPAPALSVAPDTAYRLLLVDDEPNVLSALKRAFRLEHYQVETAANGMEALEILRQRPVQVMISDYQMPRMNGGELLREARALAPDTLRIMLTGHADSAAVMSAVKEGAVYKFILKPWNDDDLRVTVALALEQWELKRRNQALAEDVARKSREIAALSRIAVNHRSQLAVVLHKRGLLTSAQLQELHRVQENRKEPILGLLLERGWVPEKTIRGVLTRDMLLQEVDPAEFTVDPAVAALVPRTFCERQLVVPLRLEGRKLTLAFADPLDEGLIDDLRFVSGLAVEPVLAGVAAIRAKIAQLYGAADEEVRFEDLETLMASPDPYEGIEVVIDEDEDSSLDELLRGTEEPPAIRLVNAIILEAIRLRASDIHIQPRTKSVVVRLRVDGVLADKIHIPHQMHQSLVSRLKVMSELDIAERRRPQDGRISVRTPSRTVDLRISTLPTINGEKVVLRILDRGSSVVGVTELGFSAADRARVLRMVDKPQGIILATGPTGSGKTTSLYSLLQHNATPEKNYVTIEDPVEYYLDMAGQVLIREKIGLTFPSALRAILRQDPDVILLGEIRDLDTAEVAFHAALTGHQVYSTLHTNSALATVARLLDLGLKPFVVASALEGIIAQRLVRRVCEHCRQPHQPEPELLRRLGLGGLPAGEVSRGAGCGRCHGSGYAGRLGIYEVVVPDERVRQMISDGASLLDLTRAVREVGTGSLFDDAMEKVAAGLTTLDEVLRVLGPQ